VTKKLATVEGLKSDDFALTENGVRRALCGVVHDRESSSIGILLDTSGSMGFRFNALALATAGIRQLLDTSAPDDEYFLGYADDGPMVRRRFTRDLATIRSGLQVSSKGKTAVIDAVYAALQSMRAARHSNRALLVMSDGYDNVSTYRVEELARLLSDIPITIFLVIPADPFDRVSNVALLTEMEIGARKNLVGLVEGSGGYCRTVSTIKDMTASITQMSPAIRSPYVLYFAAAAGIADRPGDVTIGVKSMRPAPLVLYRGARRYTQ
jgi:Ca-activated chloride channel family protein